MPRRQKNKNQKPDPEATSKEAGLKNAGRSGGERAQATDRQPISGSNQILRMHGVVGNRNVGRLLVSGWGGSRPVRRRVSAEFDEIRANLTYGLTDLVVTDAEAHAVLESLDGLNEADLRDTVDAMRTNTGVNLVARLLDNVSASDRSAFAGLIARIRSMSTPEAALAARMIRDLEYGSFDWAITDAEAAGILQGLAAMPELRRKRIILRLCQENRVQRLLDNIAAGDRATHAALITEIENTRDEFRDQAHGTHAPTAGQERRTEEILTPGVARVGGVPAPFVDDVGGKSYRDDLVEALDAVLAWMGPDSRDTLARPELPLSDFEEIGNAAKDQADSLFGHYAASATAFTSGVNLTAVADEPPDPAELVRYLVFEQDSVRSVHPRHSALPESREPERTIAQGVIASYSAAHTADLEAIDRAWPAFASGGTVSIQTHADTAAAARRRVYWDSFQTMIHEYLHKITHNDFEDAARGLGGGQGSILIEGVTSLMTDKVWESIFPGEIRSNDELRESVEQRAYPFNASVIPDIDDGHYDQIDDARLLEANVGEPNLRAAYFDGRVDLLGLPSRGP